MKITANTLDLDKENFVLLLELSMEGLVKVGWSITDGGTKVEVLAGESKSTIAERLGKMLKLHFVGDGYFEERGAEKAREYAQALSDMSYGVFA